MKNSTLTFLQFLISALRSGRSTQQAIALFKEKHRSHWGQLHLSKPKKIPVSSIEYELSFLLNQGLKGYPILPSLCELNSKAVDVLHHQIDLHTAKSPFLALIPLFTLQMPSLILIFIFPLLNDLLENFT